MKTAITHTGDIDCEPYPINSGKSAWIYRLYDPLDGLSSPNYFSLNIYPNPAHHQIFIDLPEHTDLVQIEILDVFGNSIAQLKALPQQNQVIWNCNGISVGVYFYQTEIEEVVYRGKIVVQH